MLDSLRVLSVVYGSYLIRWSCVVHESNADPLHCLLPLSLVVFYIPLLALLLGFLHVLVESL